MTGNFMLRNLCRLMLCALLGGIAPSSFITGGFTVGWIAAANAEEEIPYLLTAASKGDLATVRAMLSSGVNPNTKDADGITALMYAARKDKAEVVEALLDKGADINAKDSGGWTA